MKIHYYLGWFNDGLPDRLRYALQQDITDRKSIVFISASPSADDIIGTTEHAWLNEANIFFDTYDVIGNHVLKEHAYALLQRASVIFLVGGDAMWQNDFLMRYELANIIKKSNAIIIGASAGAINMSAMWLCSNKLGFPIEQSHLYDGIGLNDFSVLSHFDLEHNMTLVQQQLQHLSKKVNIYVSNKDCAIRAKDENIDIVGDVYVIADGMMRKLEETLYK